MFTVSLDIRIIKFFHTAPEKVLITSHISSYTYFLKFLLIMKKIINFPIFNNLKGIVKFNQNKISNRKFTSNYMNVIIK